MANIHTCIRWLTRCIAAAGFSVAAACGSTVTGTGGSSGTGGHGGTSLCGPGTIECSGTCVDTKVDPANCGVCGKACPSGQLCSVGVCGLDCTGGTTLCGSACVDLQQDPLNCGVCEKACTTGQVCSGGACGVQCTGGTTLCGSTCVNTQLDPANCGMCGKACTTGQVCSAGACGLVCTGTSMLCGSVCVDVQQDPANCGGCGKVCGSANAMAFCTGGACGLACTTGFADCNGMNADGCEVNTGNDPGNCGMCGKACSTGGSCVSGSCVAPLSCAQIHAADATKPSGVYTIDVDGAGPLLAFPVYCDMTTAGGGWTLVARELASTTGTLKFLDADTGNDAALAAGTASGIIGHRFAGNYMEFWIAWNNGQYIRATFAPAFDVFSNTVNTAIPLTGFSSSDPNLSGWVTTAGGAKFCEASHDSDIRPGDTSWAVKPVSDNNTSCGCSNGNWIGEGAYYGGSLNQTSCSGWGGGWAGVVATGVPKGGITPTYETDLYIR